MCSKDALAETLAPRLDDMGPWPDTESTPSPQAIHLHAPALPGGGFAVWASEKFAHCGLHGARPGKTRRG